MIVLVSKVLNRTVAVAFKYIKKTKHRSDILNGLNIMQNLAMQVTLAEQFQYLFYTY